MRIYSKKQWHVAENANKREDGDKDSFLKFFLFYFPGLFIEHAQNFRK